MHNGQPIDPTTHISYQRLAWTLVERIQCLLRPDEVDDCAHQFYVDIREHFAQEPAPGKEGNSHVQD
jgi:hypothetical protein